MNLNPAHRALSFITGIAVVLKEKEHFIKQLIIVVQHINLI